MNPDASRLLDEGIDLSTEGRFLEAIERLKQAVQLDPGSSGAYVHLGRAYFRLRRTDEALLAFQAAVRLAPRSAAAHKWLGMALLAHEQVKEAVIELGTAAAIEPDVASTYVGLYIALQAAGRTVEAEQAMKRAKKLNPEIEHDMAEMLFKVGEGTELREKVASLMWKIAPMTGYWSI